MDPHPITGNPEILVKSGLGINCEEPIDPSRRQQEVGILQRAVEVRQGDLHIARIEHTNFEQWERHLRRDKDGKVFLWNEKMRIKADKQGGGLGVGRLRAQVENAFLARQNRAPC